MRTKERVQAVIDHLEQDLTSRLLASSLQPVAAWGHYHVDDERGAHACVGTVSLYESVLREDERVGSLVIEVKLPPGSDGDMDEYQDCLIESLDAGNTFSDAFMETSVQAEEKWPSNRTAHAVVMVELEVRLNRLFQEE
ncbi:MAG: hypothetical protein K9L75_06610 [Spirochaetia bacterium]|nr:hypothetical protein [Spirochaetia bacterium]